MTLFPSLFPPQPRSLHAASNVSAYQMTSLEFPFCKSNDCSINTTGRSTDSNTKRRRIQLQIGGADKHRMVNYTTAASDVEKGAGQDMVVLVEKKPSTGWMGKLFLAMFLVVVCCAGALLFAWYWNGRQERQVRVGPLLKPVSQKSHLNS